MVIHQHRGELDHQELLTQEEAEVLLLKQLVETEVRELL
jgi:hypothetical protein